MAGFVSIRHARGCRRPLLEWPARKANGGGRTRAFGVLADPLSCGHEKVRQRRRRARLDRLRDRIRAVSHRIRRSSGTSQPRETLGDCGDEREARGDGRSESEDPLPAESPVRTPMGTRREVKAARFFKSALASERFVVSYARENIF